MFTTAAILLLLPGARALSLPAVHATAPLPAEARWSVTVGDVLYHSPPTSLLELSQDVSDYYYAAGSQDALTEAMKARRVGGAGRWHIFHLPQGPSMLQVESSGDRRATLSSLVQLKHGTVMPKEFPEYKLLQTEVDSRANATKAQEQSAAALITVEMYKDYLQRLVGLSEGGVETRSSSNKAASEQATQFLKDEFEKMGYTTCLHSFADSLTVSSVANVVAYLPGSEPGKTVTVGAHYDTRPYESGVAAPGAEDNGSGVAALLSIAKAFAAAKIKPVRSIYFVGFGAEEVGLRGSEGFAKALYEGGASGGIPDKCRAGASFLQVRSREALGQRHAAIALDEIGWRSPNLATATINLESFDWTRELMTNLFESNQAHNGDGLRVVHSNYPFGSDHMSFLNRKVPAVLIINGDDEEYPNYHKSTDTIENVDMEYATKVTKMVFGGLVRQGGLQG